MMLRVKSGKTTELIDITKDVAGAIRQMGMRDGAVLLFVPHTTAGITINEAADPCVATDIMNTLNRVVPWEAGYTHQEGNSPAHIKAVIVGSSEMVAVEDSKLVLGTWQGIFFCEFDGPRTRKLLIKPL